MSDSLNHAITQLILTKRFFGECMLRIKQVRTTKEELKGLASISVQNNKVVMKIAMDEFSKMSLDLRTAILQHELLHLVLGHLSTIDPTEKATAKTISDHRYKNFAMDLVINQVLDIESVIESELKDENGNISAVTIKSMKDTLGVDLPRSQSWVYYFHKLKDLAKENQKLRDAIEVYEFDLHDWEEGDPIKDAVIKGLIRDSAVSSAGSMSSGLTELVNQLLQSKVCWKKYLRNVVSDTISVNRTKTRSRVNRRYGLLYPGDMLEFDSTIVFIEDTSGSMSVEQIAQGRAELKRIKRENPAFKVYLIQADSEVKEVMEIERNTDLSKVQGRGGTAYSPAIKKAVDLNANLIIYYGDMDCADTPEDPKIPVLWAVSGPQKPPVKWGKYVRVE